jgi:hypothetical protein
MWKEEITDYAKRKGVIEQNTKAVFAVIWEQCSKSMRDDKVKTLEDYKTNLAEGDCVWLLNNIKGIMLRFEGQQSLFLSLDDAMSNLFLFRQGPDMSLFTYKTEFENLVDVFEHYGGTIGAYPALIALVPKRIKEDDERAKFARGMKLDMMFLNRSNRRRYGTLWNDLENQYARHNRHYPTDLTEAFSMLVSYKPPFTTATKKQFVSLLPQLDDPSVRHHQK